MVIGRWSLPGGLLRSPRQDIQMVYSIGRFSDRTEPPLLEELGVNWQHIRMKTLTVLNPLRTVDQNLMDDTDLAGPIIFCLLFATFLFLGGKPHFGYVYGFILLGTISLHFILNLMSPTGINLFKTASVLGYCLLPLVLTSALGVILSLEWVS